MGIALQKMLQARLEAEKRRRENCDLLIVDKDKQTFPYNLHEKPKLEGQQSKETLHSFFSQTKDAEVLLPIVTESVAESEKDPQAQLASVAPELVHQDSVQAKKYPTP